MGKLAAQAILSDPEFDVEGFVKNINIHYKNKQIVKALGSDPDIFLGLVQNDECRFLEIQPNFISKKIFPHISKKGYEVWEKHASDTRTLQSDWYGLIIDESLAVLYRSLGNTRSYSLKFKVYKGEGAAERIRKSWKAMKLHKVGEAAPVKNILPVYKIRMDARRYYQFQFELKNGWRRNEPTKTEFWWWGRGNGSNMRFWMNQSGKDKIRVSVECFLAEACTKEGMKPLKGSDGIVTLNMKLPLDDPHIALKAIDWASKATTSNRTYCSRGLDVMIAKRKAVEGIV